MIDKHSNSTILMCVRLLSRRDRKKIVAVAILQIFLSLLDLVAVALVGILAALAIRGVESGPPGNKVSYALRHLGLSHESFQTQVAILGIAAGVILVGRTLASVYLTKKTLFFLSSRGALLSGDLVSKLLNQSILEIQQRTNQMNTYIVTQGVEIIVLRILGALSTLTSDLALLVIMAVGLFVVDFTMAISAILVFGVIGFALYRLMHKRSQTLGGRNAILEVSSQEKLVEALNAFREISVANRRAFYANEFKSIRFELSEVAAETAFMPNISKYVLESTVVLGAIVISGLQFMLHDAVHAVATLSVFLAAGTRIAPAALRIQQGAIQIKSGLGSAQPTLDLISELSNTMPLTEVNNILDLEHKDFIGSIKLSKVSKTYEGKSTPAVSDVSIEIKQGETVAVVGPSGAGKTSLIDLILGVLAPDKGEVLVAGLSPEGAIQKWPGAIAYVPQDVGLSSGTIRENVALGYPKETATDKLVLEALTTAGISNLISELPNGLDTKIGERGARISGGQRQRLGIARALFSKPLLLVMDEATSALDGESELRVSEAIQKLKGSTTVILIAHRLSTVRGADQVIYMDQGKIISIGNFEEIRSRVPDFDRQATLMGLTEEKHK